MTTTQAVFQALAFVVVGAYLPVRAWYRNAIEEGKRVMAHLDTDAHDEIVNSLPDSIRHDFEETR